MISSKLQMRRFENAVKDPAMISAMLDQMITVHVGCFDEEYPYVVPLTFGYEIADGKLIVYLHSAKDGHKNDLWEKDPHVALTFSTYYNHPDRLYRGRMHDYRSVMALGKIERIDRKLQPSLHANAMQRILRHNARRPSQFSVPHYMFMAVYRVVCDWDNVVGKMENPVETPEEIPFPDVYNLPERNDPYDAAYFYHKKKYQPAEGVWPAALPPAGEWKDTPLPLLGAETELAFSWSVRRGFEDADIDVSALVLDEDGKVPRRYDMAFYNQPMDRGRFVILAGDDALSAVRGSESLRLKLGQAPDYVASALVILSRYQADRLGSGLEAISSLNVSVRDISAGTVPASFSVPSGALSGPSCLLMRLDRKEDGWTLSKLLRPFESWRILDQAALFGLAKWQE